MQQIINIIALIIFLIIAALSGVYEIVVVFVAGLKYGEWNYVWPRLISWLVGVLGVISAICVYKMKMGGLV